MAIHFPNVLNVAKYFGIANVEPTRKPQFHLLVVAVVVVPVEIKSHRKFEIEDLDTFHRVPIIMEPNRIGRGRKWGPAWHRYDRTCLKPCPIERQHRSETAAPQDFRGPHS